MSIIRKVKAIEKLFDQLQKEISSFQTQTGLHCVAGCGKCCNKPDIEATPLEFLPLAYFWFAEGKAEIMLEKMRTENSAICTIYSPLSIGDVVNGSCSIYKHRGLICRLFGYGASKDKFGELRMVTCKILKEQQVESYQKAMMLLKDRQQVPVISDYYQKLMQIDFDLANRFMPINKAIMEALEVVMQHYAYRPFKKPGKAA